MKNENNINFLNDLIDGSTKKKYQGFIAELGIDRVSILIPLDKQKAFIQEAQQQHPENKKHLLEIVRQFDGMLDEG